MTPLRQNNSKLVEGGGANGERGEGKERGGGKGKGGKGTGGGKGREGGGGKGNYPTSQLTAKFLI